MKIRTEIYLGLANPLVRKRTQRGPTNNCPSRTKCMASSCKDSESSPQDISRLCQGVVVDPGNNAVAGRTDHHRTFGNNPAARRNRITNTSVHMPMRRLAASSLD